MTKTVEVTKEVATELHRMHGEISELIRQRDELARLVKSHNAEINDICDTNRKRSTCRMYTDPDEQCPECPRDFLVDLPEWCDGQKNS